MTDTAPSSRIQSSIIDNHGENTLQLAIENISGGSKEVCIATAFFSLEALGMIGQNLYECDGIRILFGHEADRMQRAKLLERLRLVSDADLAEQRLIDPTLSALQKVEALFQLGRVKARCYTAKKFHAKAYLATRVHFPNHMGVLGSGNLTRPGLTQNVELNVHLTAEQTSQLKDWFDRKWGEAVEDDVTVAVAEEIRRQIALYDPYAIYQRALLAWGRHFQGTLGPQEDLTIKPILDPHQALGYSRAIEILNRQHGVMICDGVGLGKSFIALALMEHFCRRKKNVLLIAPKSIMSSSWSRYLEEHLGRFRQPFGTILEVSMTDLGFDADEEPTTDKMQEKLDLLEKLIERADVIVVDESHNFRTPSSLRYENLIKITESLSLGPERRKKVILLTATPVNTAYMDLTAQLALITQDQGTLAGYPMDRIKSAAREMDKTTGPDAPPQLALDFHGEPNTLDRVLEAVLIQRKRTTCIELAQAVGKTLTFPIREDPTVLDYELNEPYKRLVELTHRRFAPTAAFLKRMKDQYKEAEEKGIEFVPTKIPTKFEGIKFAAFLPEQYRKAGPRGGRTYQVEMFLAGLVFTNTLKQLESSPPAFQGILQSLGTGLIARLKYVFGEAADRDIEPHQGWVLEPINTVYTTDSEADVDSGELAEANGRELDEWLEKVIQQRHVYKKLADFTEEEFDRERWRKDILKDLEHLRDIHRETLEARNFLDFKLQRVEKVLAAQLQEGRRVVIFTQSVRTSFYLEKQLGDRFANYNISRIDSNVKQETRDDLLHAFCPNYNPKPRLFSRERVDVLISTDVLSEGVNMQEAECILNYDIHWNPVRLIQRIGRVDRRLDPEKNPVPHSFSIINCLPPPEINDIIQLVDTVENRTTKISRTLGIDEAFFKSTDPAGTLREFNAQVDGEPTLTDRVNERYVQMLANPDPTVQKAVEAMPPGAFGVWEGAPTDGVFALFEMRASPKITQEDRDLFQSVIGMPMLALHSAGKIGLDGVEILNMLAGTVKGEKSGTPGDPAYLGKALNAMRSKINQSFKGINLVATIQPKLVCWMELRKNG